MGPLVGPRWVAREQPMPIAPTIATPGTTEKMDIMAERASRDEPLFHIDDAETDRIDPQWDNTRWAGVETGC